MFWILPIYIIITNFIFAHAFGGIVYLGVVWAIMALFESSEWQGSPGKKVLRLKVTDMDGNRIVFGRAFGRNACELLSTLILGIGYMMAGWTKKKQALHDMIMDCLVIRSVD